MLTDGDIIRVPISPAELSFLQRHAQRAELGGRSSIRGAEDRQDKLRQDQIVGLVGHFAGIKSLFGDVRLFRLQRHFADLYPAIGDGGSDVPGSNIDFKSSLITKPNLLDYKLAVRGRERHRGMNYVLVLVELEPKPVAHLVGWASEASLPQTPESTGPFTGAYVLKASQLNPLMRLTWFEDAASAPVVTEVTASDIKWYRYKVSFFNKFNITTHFNDFASNFMTKDKSFWSCCPATHHMLITSANIRCNDF